MNNTEEHKAKLEAKLSRIEELSDISEKNISKSENRLMLATLMTGVSSMLVAILSVVPYLINYKNYACQKDASICGVNAVAPNPFFEKPYLIHGNATPFYFLTIIVAAYIAISYINERHLSVDFLSKYFKIFSWQELKAFGAQPIARLSYVALVLIPVIVSFILNNPFDWPVLLHIEVPVTIKASFFISLYLSFALSLFATGAPKELKPSTDDKFKILNLTVTNSNSSNIVVGDSHENSLPDIADISNPLMRSFCWLFYLLSVVYAVTILLGSAEVVIKS